MIRLILFVFVLGSSFLISAQQAPKPDSLKEYTGKYKFPEGSEVTEVQVVIENDTLWVNSDKGNSELRRIEKDIFEVVTYTGTATFKRDEHGKVNGLHFEVGNLVLDGKKSEEPASPKSDKLQRSPENKKVKQ